MAEGWHSGETIGRFRLEEKVGSGGFGETWRAHDELLDVDVALKAFSNVDPSRRDRYVREARALARFSSEPGIASVRDLIEVDGDICLVMDYVAGEDLADVVERQGKLTLEQTVAVLAPVASVLDRLHEAGMVHRDVSPDNVRVTPEGTGTLLDFGSVLGASHREGVTVTVRPGFAPPEQFGDVATQGPWTDVYALAATAYCCLVGTPPADSLQRTFADTVKRPSELGVSLPAVAEDALMRALALDYHARTQHAGELLQGLRGAAGAPATTVTSQAVQTASSTGAKTGESAGAKVGSSGGGSGTEVGARNETGTKTEVGTKAEAGAKTEAGPRTDGGRKAEGKPETKTATAQGKGTGWEKSSRDSRQGFDLRKLILPLAVLAVVALIGGALVLARFGASSSSTGQQVATVMDQGVNPDTIDEATRSAEVTKVSFVKCVVSDEAIQRLSERSQVTEISFDACTGFTDLSPLAALPNLTDLRISGMESASLAKLFPKEMPTVEHLAISMVEVSGGTDALSHFTGLTRLDLTPVAGVSDISFVGALPKLEELDLSGIDLSGDASAPLAKAKGLKRLSVNLCELSAIDFVSDMPELEELQVVGNHLSDISPLADCPKLATLWMSQNQVHDLSPLKACAELEDLVADANGLSSIDGVSGHESLWRVSLADNSLTTADGLEGLEALSELSLARNRLSDISALADSTSLRRVDLSSNQLADVMALAACGKMEYLSLASNQLENLDVCERFIALEQLNASHNRLTDVSKLASCSKLELLALQDNQIASIDALGNGFVKLLALNVSFNRITSVASLAECSKLRFVVMNDNQVTTLDGMQDKPELDSLLASNNQITDISALESSTGVLENLDLGNNQISDVTCLSGMGSADKYGVRCNVLLDHNRITSAEGLPFGTEFYALALHANPLTDLSTLSRTSTDWNALYLPYSEDIDYAQLGELDLVSTTHIVDAPYDQQNNILRSMGISDNASSVFTPQPRFVTAEEAEGELKALRDRINDKVSGTDRTSSIGSDVTEATADPQEAEADADA